jgi:hypothetical protein
MNNKQHFPRANGVLFLAHVAQVMDQYEEGLITADEAALGICYHTRSEELIRNILEAPEAPSARSQQHTVHPIFSHSQ